MWTNPGDQLCSLVNVFNDLSYCFCFYFTGDFITDDSTRCSFVTKQTVWILSLAVIYEAVNSFRSTVCRIPPLR